MLLIKKRGAPRSCFCGPHPQKNVFDREHIAKANYELKITNYEWI